MVELATITYSGDWNKFERFLAYEWRGELIAAVGRATRASALLILAEIRKRITERRYLPNAKMTIARKGHDVPLVDKGLMIRSMSVQRVGNMAQRVGFIEDQKASRGGKMLFDVIPIIHDGATVDVDTPNGKRTVRVPPRPFLESVWNDPGIIRDVNARWEKAIEKVLKKYGAL